MSRRGIVFLLLLALCLTVAGCASATRPQKDHQAVTLPLVSETLKTPKQIQEARRQGLEDLWADGWVCSESAFCVHGGIGFDDITVRKNVDGVLQERRYCPYLMEDVDKNIVPATAKGWSLGEAAPCCHGGAGHEDVALCCVDNNTLEVQTFCTYLLETY